MYRQTDRHVVFSLNVTWKTKLILHMFTNASRMVEGIPFCFRLAIYTYITPRRIWERLAFYYADRFRKWFYACLSICPSSIFIVNLHVTIFKIFRFNLVHRRVSTQRRMLFKIGRIEPFFVHFLSITPYFE